MKVCSCGRRGDSVRQDRNLFAETVSIPALLDRLEEQVQDSDTFKQHLLFNAVVGNKNKQQAE